MKEAIKEMIELQKEYKKQRKQSYTGKRMQVKNWRGEMVELDQWMAASKAKDMKDELRSYYIAYGMLRGKALDQIEPSRKTEPNMRAVERIMEGLEDQFKRLDDAA